MYLIISGYPPFYAQSREELFKLITSGNVEYTEPIWNSISKECKDLLKRMLTYDTEKRISAKDALKSPWIIKHKAEPDFSDIDLRLSLNNLKKFRTQMTFQRAVLAYLASQTLQKQDEQKIRKVFEIFDVNKDGQISKTELVAGYNALYKDSKKAKREVKRILSNIDLNNNGRIDYNGISIIILNYYYRIFNSKYEIEFSFKRRKIKTSFCFL